MWNIDNIEVNNEDSQAVPIVIVDPNDSTRKGEFDNLLQAFVTISESHHEIHEGDTFHSFVNDTTMANNDVIEIAFTTPAVATPQKRVHLVYDYSSEATGNFSIIEGVTGLAIGGGTAFTPINKQRASTNVSVVTNSFTGQTGAAITYTGGTTIWLRSWGGNRSSLSEDRATHEIILAPATSYVFKLTNTSGGTQVGFLSLTWYEHTDD